MENLPHSEQERGSHTVSLATSRGKRPVLCLDCLGVDHRQFLGSIVSALMTHLELWTGCGLCGCHASEGGRKAALSTPHRNTEAQTDWRGGGPAMVLDKKKQEETQIRTLLGRRELAPRVISHVHRNK